MQNVWTEFRNAGSVGWLILLLGIMALPLGLIALSAAFARVKRFWALLLVIAAIFAVTLGLLLGPAGAALGMITVEGAVSGESIEPSQKALILHEGFEEARSAYHVALFMLGLPSVVILGALVVLLFRKREDGPFPKALLGMGVPILLLLGANLAGSARANPYRKLSEADSVIVDLEAEMKTDGHKAIPCTQLFLWVERNRTTQAPKDLAPTLDIPKNLNVCTAYFIATPPDVVSLPIEKWKMINPGKAEPETGYDVFARSTYLKTVLTAEQGTQLRKAGEAYRASRTGTQQRRQ
jgi:hypothetical protein